MISLVKLGKVINLSPRKKFFFFFRTIKGRRRKEKYEDLENKHLYWCVNNMKKEYLDKGSDDLVEIIENDDIEEQLSDIVGIKANIPSNSCINENAKKLYIHEQKKNVIERSKIEEINKIFNPSLDVLKDKELDFSSDADNYLIRKEIENRTDNIIKNKNNNNNSNSNNNNNSNDNNINWDGHFFDIKEGKENINNNMSKSVNKLSDKNSNNTLVNNTYDNMIQNCNSKTDINMDKEYCKNEKNDNMDDYNFMNVDNDQKSNSLFDYESLKSKSNYQDLTHAEYDYMNNLYLKKCDLDRKIRWFKMNNMLNPVKEAKSIINSLKLSKEEKKKNNNEENDDPFLIKEDIKPYYQDEGRFSNKIEKICEQNQYDEIVSRIRMKIRKEKLENSKIIKEKIPNVANHILDPIKYHVNRRRIRVEKLLHTHLEQLLNCNNSYFRFYLLNGLSISIHHLEMKSTRSMCKIVYSLLNKNVTHDMIKDKLEKVAFVLRKLLARKLQLGYTPPLKFIPLSDQQEKNIKHIQYYKLYSKYNHPSYISDKKDQTTNLIDFYNKDLAGF
ncbi:hypothetical protein PGSY75_1241300 [Plasmodium gaboni]|uniref:Ribosome-binding factor A n=1 Tax=Plasmodium gaboni TaxID=647221 RepID=A0A151LH35_9APIC|nr:hypothetical protein PGSY75_1241300 [Plasmodium gaboni]KYN98197.1 hypothetical protein PGSY75_1241300 [Plasmodium gaboni]